MKTQNAVITTILAIIFLCVSQISFAQFDIQGKVQKKVDEKIDEKIDNTIDNGIDGVFKKKDRDKKDDSEEEEDTKTEDDDMVDSESEETETEVEEEVKPADKQKLESYSKYDFIPGDQILFFEDFSQDAVGDFPALWTSNGGGEVKTVNIATGKWLHMNGSDAMYSYLNEIKFPTNFIIEFDIIPDAIFAHGYQLTLYNDPENKEMNNTLYPGVEGVNIDFWADGWSTKAYRNNEDWIEGESKINPVEKEVVNHVIIWVQNRRVRIYHAGAKVLDVPTNLHNGTVFNRMRFSGWDRNAFPLFTNLKITTAAPDMRSKLLTEGKLVSYGIYFDSGKDVVKPESYGSLKEIAAVLTENPTVNIQIVGHTDSDGDDAMNLDLSKRRAANVKNSLVNDFGISTDRIQSDGKGESVPLIPNTSVENKAKNRRVEFIKL
ncbi:MAG TPA: OmpA family protein [Bacteroidales bacterium]|nr:OmpA family protein [Bacteroidales bacterium]